MKIVEAAPLIKYIETPRYRKAPVKIDAVLEARIQTFMRARRIERFTFVK